jgi:D-alanyl-lipoteichoic acid acyltransferase DltB (MBOAT superfamily)
MVFHSLPYFVFLPVVFLLFCLAKDRFRWMVLLAASLLFYSLLMAPHLLLALLAVASVTYGAGRAIGTGGSSSRRRIWFWGGVAFNLLVLGSLKYLPLLLQDMNAAADSVPARASMGENRYAISIGVSYFVFQAISYMTDVYAELEKPERHFGHLALYLAFFPKLLQGPIERAGDLLPQLKSKYEFRYESMRLGLLLFAWGLFKKVVVADRIARYVDAVYVDVHAYAGLPLLLATYGYAFQLYCDFSGYTDMALGSAALFNIRLTQNFRGPYFADSIADFWRRWHISFSRWIFDYLFKPLQMEFRDGKALGTVAALVLTFLASGLWHGAGWGFVVWGLLHGIYLSASVLYQPLRRSFRKRAGLENSRLIKAWGIFVTFNLVCLSWVFFRSERIGDAFYVLSNLFRGVVDPNLRFADWPPLESLLITRFGGQEAVLAVVCLGTVLAVDLFNERRDAAECLLQKPPVYRWCAYCTLALSIVMFGAYGGKSFLYFQF